MFGKDSSRAGKPFEWERLERTVFLDEETAAFLSALSSAERFEAFKGNSRMREAFLLEYSYISAALEGCRYTLQEAVLLLKQGLTANKKWTDAVMLKNIFGVLEGVMGSRGACLAGALTKSALCAVHEGLSRRLVEDECCGKARRHPVRITGTSYEPLNSPDLLDKALETMLQTAERCPDPFNKSICLHLNLAYLQYFIDCNKRTARMIQTAVLYQNGKVPLLLQDKDKAEYMKAVCGYYETGSADRYAGLFVQAYCDTMLRFCDAACGEECRRFLEARGRL